MAPVKVIFNYELRARKLNDCRSGSLNHVQLAVNPNRY